MDTVINPFLEDLKLVNKVLVDRDLFILLHIIHKQQPIKIKTLSHLIEMQGGDDNSFSDLFNCLDNYKCINIKWNKSKKIGEVSLTDFGEKVINYVDYCIHALDNNKTIDL